ncbi:E3 ubiquitin-protein ligase Topors isoform X1 [Capsicum annuum]|uniref:E3 ubiquitin-protein ligase Topors isoform X1 n=1 Tax=Capsicum annuum TaxID=4072 RepID=UPI001FB116C2|nr:E3 ubiquitin-protein ligase Topors isoform X1 [Capsicum annuum]
MEYRFQEIACAVTRKSCPICLCRLHHGSAAVIIPCMHAYCILCIRRWSDVKRKCPLCNADFGSWFSKISFSSLTFREEKLSAPAETKKLHSGFLRSTLSNRLAHRRVIRRRREELNASGSRTRLFLKRRSFDQIVALNPDDITRRIILWRSSIYEERLQAVLFSSKNCLMQHMENRSTKEKMLQRVEPWIRRELQAILGDPDPSIIVHVATSLFISENTHSTQRCAGDDFLAPLRPFLHGRAEMFWHELRSSWWSYILEAKPYLPIPPVVHANLIYRALNTVAFHKS